MIMIIIIIRNKKSILPHFKYCDICMRNNKDTRELVSPVCEICYKMQTDATKIQKGKNLVTRESWGYPKFP